MQVQVQVQPQQQQIQENTSQQQPVQQNTEQQIVQVCTSISIISLNLLIINFPNCWLLFSGADPGSAARSDAGPGSSSALWLPSTATRCDYCTADSVWGAYRRAAPTSKYKTNSQDCKYLVSHFEFNIFHLYTGISCKRSWWQLLQGDSRSKFRQWGPSLPPSIKTVQRGE